MAQTSDHTEIFGVRIPRASALGDDLWAQLEAGTPASAGLSRAMAICCAGDRVLDLGAQMGLAGAVIARNRVADAVWSVASDPETYGFIESVHAANELPGDVQLHAAPAEPVPFHLTLLEALKPTVLLIEGGGSELSFLRDADLDGVRAISITFHPEIYGKLGMQEAKTILGSAGFRKLGRLSSRFEWVCTRDIALNAAPPAEELADPPRPDGGWSTDIISLTGARVIPPASSGFVQHSGVLTADGTYVREGALWRKGQPLTLAPELPKTPLDVLDGRWIWGGPLWRNFAHFIAESTSRLWAVDQLDLEEIDGIVFTPKRPKNGQSDKPFHRSFLNLLAPELDIRIIDQPTVVEELHVPGQGFGLGEISSGTDAFRQAFANRFAADIEPEGPDKLYISRSKIGMRGSLIGEQQLEQYLRDEGYEIFHPQEHDLAAQIARYRAADKIIACEGSALHVVAFVAQAHQQIAMILRRKSAATSEIAAHLTSFTGRAPVTVDALAGMWLRKDSPRKRLALGEIDFVALQARLSEAGFIRGQRGTWLQLPDEEVLTIAGADYVPPRHRKRA